MLFFWLTRTSGNQRPAVTKSLSDIEFRPQRKKGIWSSTAGFVSEGLESKRVGRRKEEEEEHKYGLLSSRLSRQRWKKRSQVMDAPKTSTRVVFLSRCAAARCSRRREDVLFSIILSLFFILLQARSTERERERDLLIFLFEQTRKNSNDWSALTHSIPTRTCHPLVRSALRQRYYLPVLGRNHHNHKLVKSRRHWAKSRAINQSHSLACVP